MSGFGDMWNRLVETLDAWLTDAVTWAPRVVVALVVVGAFWWLGKIVRKGVTKALKKTKMSPSPRALLARASHFLVSLVGLMVTLSVLQLDEAVTGILAGAGVVGLALGFAFQDLASNLISGVGLSVRHPFRVGDVIESNGMTGVVEDVQLRVTVMRTFDGKKVIIPNKKIYQDVLTNFSAMHRRRVDVACGVAYDTDLATAKKLALEALESLECRIEDKPPEIFFKSFGGSSIDFDARVWIEYRSQRDFVEARDAIVMAIKKAFDQGEVEIPFPIRTLELADSAAELLGRRVEAESEAA